MRGMFFIGLMGVLAAPSGAQQASTPPPGENPNTPLVRAETRLVLVDAVVTDKHGDYIRDLSMKDFRVWEDNNEQKVKTFSFGGGAASPSPNDRHYMVLLFDNSSIKVGDQMYARQAALRFLDTNTGPNRYIAIADFTGTLKITQNFTTDKERLKQVVNGVKLPMGGGDLASSAVVWNDPEMDLQIRSSLDAIRTLAKGLAHVPGRKMVVWLSAGFVLDSENRPELTATIDACNKANVAVYPIDPRGLAGPISQFEPGPFEGSQHVRFVLASYSPQHGGGAPSGGSGGHGGVGTGGGAGTSGGRGGTSTGTGGRGGTTGTSGSSTGTRLPGTFSNTPFNQARSIVPQLPPSPMVSQSVLYEIASGTGGFVIVNTNDLLGGLQKITREEDEYYVLGYTPENSEEGTCHTLRVKVDRGGTNVRSRSGYCNDKPLDLLAGTPTERELESRAASTAAGNVNATMELPYFYTGVNTARVNVAMEIPSAALKFNKVKGKLHSEVNVLGIAYKTSDSSVAAKFSDTLKLDFEKKKELEEFQEKPLHYDTQFQVSSGQYTLKVVFTSGGADFGKIEMPLTIAAYDSRKFGLSGIALSKDVHRVSDLEMGLDASLLENKTPLVSSGMELTPYGSNTFKKTEAAAVYVEVYDPLLARESPPNVGLQMRIVDKKSGQQKLDTGFMNMQHYVRAGNAVVPVGLKLPLEKLDPGIYRAELKAVDTAGNASDQRSTEFVVE